MQGVGPCILAKIDEFFRKGGRFHDNNMGDGDKMAAIEELKGIHGVGDEKASRLYEKGYKSVKDLRDK